MSSNPLQLLFLGTGTSTGLPLTPCLTKSNPYPEAFSDMVPLLQATDDSKSPLAHIKGSWNPDGDWPSNIPCPCCRSAVDPDVPEGWKNKRGNTSVLVRKKNESGDYKNIVVDVGKTFREQAARFFPKWGVQTIDAVLLTHGHADAYFGLDDLREWCIRQKRAIPVYLNKETFEAVGTAFPYMVDKSKASGGGDVPTLVWKIIDDDDEFEVEGINVKSLSVHHGIYFHSVTAPGTPVDPSDPSSTPAKAKRLEPEPLICLGFMFDNSIVYISDVSSIPETTWDRLENRHRTKLNRTKGKKGILPTPASTPNTGTSTPDNGDQSDLPVFIIDALWPARTHPSHYSFFQALEAALRIRSKYTYITGSTHPTTHFMWEELCLSLNGKDGQREHPDSVQSEWLVKNVWLKAGRASQARTSEGELPVHEKWKEFGAIVRPAWDGLVIEISGEKGQEVGEVERLDQSTRGLVY